MCNAVRSRVVSMTLVNASADINVVGIHRNTQCSWHCSRISSTSSVVRYSSHDGVAVLLTKSYRLRQSVVITACGNQEKAFCGSFHRNCGIIMIPHNNLIHPRRSMLLDMEYASAERVDRTTLEIFLEDQLTGEKGASTLSLS